MLKSGTLKLLALSFTLLTSPILANIEDSNAKILNDQNLENADCGGLHFGNLTDQRPTFHLRDFAGVYVATYQSVGGVAGGGGPTAVQYGVSRAGIGQVVIADDGKSGIITTFLVNEYRGPVPSPATPSTLSNIKFHLELDEASGIATLTADNLPLSFLIIATKGPKGEVTRMDGIQGARTFDNALETIVLTKQRLSKN